MGYKKIKKLKGKEREEELTKWINFIENPESEKVEEYMKENEEMKENKEIKEAKEKSEEMSEDERMQRLAELREKA